MPSAAQKLELPAGPQHFSTTSAIDGPPLYRFGSVARYGIWHSPNDHNKESLARYAVEEYNQTENALFELVKILKAESIPVSGRGYIIIIEVRDASASGARAALNKFPVEVWEQPWTNIRKLIIWNGMPSAAQNLLLLRAVDGGKMKAALFRPSTFPLLRRSTDPQLHRFGAVARYRIGHPPNDPDIESLARYAVERYNQNENAQFELVKILKAESIPVSGRRYIITIEVSNASASGAGAALNKFPVEVWEQRWMNFRKLVFWNGMKKDYAFFFSR